MGGGLARCTTPALPDRYRRFGAWDRALAAADFSAFVLDGFAKTLPALDAADLPVCLVFFAIADHLLPAPVLQRVTRSLRLHGATQ